MTQSSCIAQPTNGSANGKVSQAEINAILWKACDTFRGTIDPSEYKNYILVMLFLKYISDVWAKHYAQLRSQHGDDDRRHARHRAGEATGRSVVSQAIPASVSRAPGGNVAAFSTS